MDMKRTPYRRDEIFGSIYSAYLALSFLSFLSFLSDRFVAADTHARQTHFAIAIAIAI